jgi:hypothetical protein
MIWAALVAQTTRHWKSRFLWVAPQNVMSALPLKADMCGATSNQLRARNSIVSCHQQISFELYSITLTSAFTDMFAMGDDGTVLKVGRSFFYRVIG